MRDENLWTRTMACTLAVAFGLVVVGCGGSGVAGKVQPQQQQQVTTENPARREPTPGPIIVLKPKRNGSVYETEWTVGGNPAYGDDVTQTGTLRFDAMGSRLTMTIHRTSGPPLLRDSISFKIKPLGGGASKTNVVEKLAGGDLKWTSGGEWLLACDVGNIDCMANCANMASGLPKEFFGEFDASNIEGIVLADIIKVEIQANWEHPCEQ